MFLLFFATFLLLWAILWAAHPPLWQALDVIGKRVAAASLRYGPIQKVFHASSPWRDYLPVILTLSFGVLLSLLAAEEFVDVAELLRQRNTRLQEIDTRAHDWAVARREGEATLFFDLMSRIGGPAGLSLIIAATAAGHFAWRKPQRAGYLIFTTAVGGLINRGLKLYFARERPEVSEMLRHASGYSFPSGHAMGSTITFAALAYLAYRALREWRWRAAAIAFAAAMVAAIALSRVYLGVHWISDIGAGVVAGLAWVTMTTVAYEGYRRIRLVRAMRASRGGVEN